MSIVLNSASALTGVGICTAGLVVTQHAKVADPDDKGLEHARIAMIVSIVLAGIWLIALLGAHKHMGPMASMVVSISVLVASLISTMVATGVKTATDDSSMEHTKQAAVVLVSAMSGLLVGFAAGQPQAKPYLDSLSSFMGGGQHDGMMSTAVAGRPPRM